MEHYSRLAAVIVIVSACFVSGTTGVCTGKWTLSVNTNIGGGTKQPGIVTLAACQETCLGTTWCVSLDYNPSDTTSYCWLHARRDGKTNNGGVSHYELVAGSRNCPLIPPPASVLITGTSPATTTTTTTVSPPPGATPAPATATPAPAQPTTAKRQSAGGTSSATTLRHSYMIVVSASLLVLLLTLC